MISTMSRLFFFRRQVISTMSRFFCFPLQKKIDKSLMSRFFLLFFFCSVFCYSVVALCVMWGWVGGSVMHRLDCYPRKPTARRQPYAPGTSLILQLGRCVWVETGGSTLVEIWRMGRRGSPRARHGLGMSRGPVRGAGMGVGMSR